MVFSTDSFLTTVKSLITGGGRAGDGEVRHDAGFAVDRPVPLSAIELDVTLTVDTSDAGVEADPVLYAGAYMQSDETNGRVIHVDEDHDTIGWLTIPIPRDYDEATDALFVRVLASQLTQSTDDDVELDSELYVKVPGESLSSDKDPTAPGTVLSTTEQWIEFDLGQQELTRGDVAIVKLITNGNNNTNGEEVLIHAIKWGFRSTLVSYDREDSDGADLR